MNENWYALLIATQVPVRTVDQAFSLFYSGRRGRRLDISTTGIIDMRKHGYKIDEIADKYKTTVSTIYSRMRRFKATARV